VGVWGVGGGFGFQIWGGAFHEKELELALEFQAIFETSTGVPDFLRSTGVSIIFDTSTGFCSEF